MKSIKNILMTMEEIGDSMKKLEEGTFFVVKHAPDWQYPLTNGSICKVVSKQEAMENRSKYAAANGRGWWNVSYYWVKWIKKWRPDEGEENQMYGVALTDRATGDDGETIAYLGFRIGTMSAFRKNYELF